MHASRRGKGRKLVSARLVKDIGLAPGAKEVPVPNFPEYSPRTPKDTRLLDIWGRYNIRPFLERLSDHVELEMQSRSKNRSKSPVNDVEVGSCFAEDGSCVSF